MSRRHDRGEDNYEYLLFEDLKPAGRGGGRCGVGNRSSRGTQEQWRQIAKPRMGKVADEEADFTGGSAGVYQELRDRKVALFPTLPRAWQIRYDLRAEVLG